MTTERQKGYSQGYAAGLRRKDKEKQKWERLHTEIREETKRKRDLADQINKSERVQVFCAALQGILSAGTWQHNGKNATTVPEHTKIAKHFMYEAIKQGVVK